ncbi:MAG: thioredoxin family protein [Candidatus Melainabacteria bacterium]|nr:thioredoxin family protein [Candidatus Melainabacteria bacterium]
MEICKIKQKAIYILACFAVVIFLFGCKGKDGKVSIFDGLPESTYLAEVRSSVESGKPLAIAFTAEWCPHCRKYKPVFSEVKELLKDKATFINIDVDDSNGTAISSKFQVKGIPTTVFVRPDGSVFKVQVGEIEKEDLTEIINDLIKSKKRKRGEPIAPFPIEPVQLKPLPSKDVEPQELIKEEEKKEEKSKVEASPAPTPDESVKDSEKGSVGSEETKPEEETKEQSDERSPNEAEQEPESDK